MVTYQQWFEAVHEAAPDNLNREQRGALTKQLAQVWNENKSDLEDWTVAEASEWATSQF